MNLKKAIAALAIVGLTLLGATGATAEYGTIDNVPAATLLLPYFEVDLDGTGTSGVNTLFSINNASAVPTVAHVVIWSDLTVPVLDFNVYLTGYDVQTINLFNIIVNGNLPQTADWDSDGVNTPGVTAGATSPQGATGDIPDDLRDNTGGEYSGDPTGWDGSFPNCGAGLPPVPSILLNRLQEGLTGQPTDFDALDPGGNGPCIGFDHGDRIARGYVTVDNVTECTVQFPGEVNYFGTATVSHENQLWGDYALIDPDNNFAIGETLVHIESEPNENIIVTGKTFYARYVSDTGADRREALQNQHATRFISGGAFDGGTSLLVWREGQPWNPVTDGLSFDCSLEAGGNTYSWYPLNETSVVAFDEQEQWEELCEPFEELSPISPPLDIFEDPVCFPLETQRTQVGVGELDPAANFGWLYLNLEVFSDGPEYAQSWVVTQMSALGRYSVGYDAMQLNNLSGIGGLTAAPTQ